MEGGLQVLSVLTPLFSTVSDQALAEEVVHKAVDEYFVRMFTGRQHLVDVFGLQGHENGEQRDPDANDGAIVFQSIFRLID